MNQQPNNAPLNVLVLDGGGVRGLSSLIILRRLLQLVEESVGDQTGQEVREGSLLPHEVFNPVVGTSTGGLIALMVGKLGMSVDDCIDQYHNLSQRIFRDGRHRRGTTLRGLMRPRYCGRRMREQVNILFRERNRDANLQMVASGYTNCAVVCRKYDSGFDRDPPLVSIPTVICSQVCREYFPCTICEAARATSAAPTYFSRQQIGDHVFIDGGLGFNNPSWAAYDHYNNANTPYHPNMTWRGARIVNLGTGTCSSKYQAPAPRKILEYVRKPRVIDLLRNAATSSEVEAARVRTLAANADFDYQRFSADTGVCWIEMDDYERLEDIRTLTDEYLARPEILEGLGKCAEGIARNYLGRVHSQPVQGGG